MTSNRSKHGRTQPPRWRRVALLAAVVTLVALGALRLALPGLMLERVNARIAAIGPYAGHVDAVEVALWRGSYALRGVTVRKRSGRVPEPFVHAARVEAMLDWGDLVRGRATAAARVDGAHFTIVHGNGAAASQTGEGVPWHALLSGMLPLPLADVTIGDARLRFIDRAANPPVDLSLDQFDARLAGLAGGEAVLALDASAPGGAPARVRGTFDATPPLEHLHFTLHVRDLELARINDLLQSYLRLDVASGRGDVRFRVIASRGRISGQLAPRFAGLDVFDAAQDLRAQQDGLLRALREGIADVLKHAFEEADADGERRFNAVIDVDARWDASERDPFAALLQILVRSFGSLGDVSPSRLHRARERPPGPAAAPRSRLVQADQSQRASSAAVTRPSRLRSTKSKSL